MHDNSSFWGTIATVVMWVGVTAMSVLFMILMHPDALGAAIFLVMMAGVGIGGSAVIWDNIVKLRRIALEAERRSSDYPAPATAKAKRNARRNLDRLLEHLDEDEIVELETLLMSREGEERA